jgi:crotonobetainyl-CoA:carnitine CoA-transferase CaiB-like acyl-CoA transferase
MNETFEDVAVKQIAPVLEFDHPRAGRVRVLKHPVRYSSGEATLRRPPPDLGEHTDAVLGELGYDAGQIQAMREEHDI